jgi:isoquinoline 1-oxidoreductase
MAIDTTELGSEALRERFSRRALVKGSGAAAAGLAVGWHGSATAQEASPAAEPALPSASPLVDNYNPQPPFGFLETSQEVDAYLSIDAEGKVTVRTSLVDFGQGIETGFLQLVAEELGVAFENVSAITGETDQVPFNIGTFGSLSTQTTGPILRGAAATMREWLLDLGAENLGVARDQLTAAEGAVFVTSDPSKTVSYGELAGGKTSGKTITPDVPLKDPGTYTIVGQPIPRIQAKEKVTGAQKYGMDARIDGQIYGKIVRPPALGAKLQDIDFSGAEAVPGFIGSFRDGDFAAIVAERYEYAELAVAAVKATWSTVDTGNTSDNIHELLKSSADAGEDLGEQPEENATPVPTPEPAAIAQPLTLTFKDAYVNHAPIEPKNALVNVTADRVDIWTSTQSPFNVRAAVAQQLGRDPETVVVHHLTSGGAFGSKILPNAEMPAAVLSNHFGKPVKIISRRDEEFQFSQFRPAMLVEVTTGLAADNTIASWQYDAYTGAYYPETAERPSDSASDWGAHVSEIYDVPAVKTTLYRGHSPLPPYFWRVNGAATNAFAREVTLNHLAELAGQDPVTFRKSLLGRNPRMAAVLDKLVAQSGWQPGVGSTGQGIGIALAFDANSCIGEAAKVTVDTSTGGIIVERFDAVIDCGLIVNPEGVRHQLEGAIVLSLSPTLKEAITFENGTVTNASFAQYAPLNISEAPRQIEVDFIEDKSNPMGGVGEPGVAPVPAAVCNAIYDATGVWIYEFPFTPERVLAALTAAGKATPAASPVASPTA